MNWKNRQPINTLIKATLNQPVHLYGWVDTIRDHGHLLFIHLRDRTGIIQLLLDPDQNKTAYTQAQSLRNEYVIEVKGTLSERSDETKNLDIPTGHIEIVPDTITVLNTAETPPLGAYQRVGIRGLKPL